MSTLPPYSELRRKPEPEPELGWCARCGKVNPRPGYPEDHEGHDWQRGDDEDGYYAGVICPTCIKPEEHLELLVNDTPIEIEPDDEEGV